MFAFFEKRKQAKIPCGITSVNNAIVRPQRQPIPLPMHCLDENISYDARRVSAVCSRAHRQSFVPVLVGWAESDGIRTRSGVLSAVSQTRSLSGVSRCVSDTPWSSEAVVARRWKYCCVERLPQVHVQWEQQNAIYLTRYGCLAEPLATGSLRGGASPRSRLEGRKEQGWGTSRSRTDGQRIIGRCIVRRRSMLLSRGSPVGPTGTGVPDRRGAVFQHDCGEGDTHSRVRAGCGRTNACPAGPVERHLSVACSSPTRRSHHDRPHEHSLAAWFR
jgi:hypothetical protein